MDEGLVLLWLPLVTVLVFEHLLLTRCYGKQSSLQRLWINGKSARADCLVWFIFYVAWPYIQSVVNFLTIPGLIYVGMVKLVGSLGWPSLFGAWMPSNPVMIFIIWLFALDFAIYVSHVL